MSNNIFSIGLSGLAAAQWGLQTAGNNISNASTTGYTVENPVYTESSGQYTGSGYLGGGVTTTTVMRNYSQYLATQLNGATSTSKGLSTNYTMTSQLNNLVGNPTAGISTAITSYFTGLQNIANSPTDLATRQSAVSAAQTLASQISAAGEQYDALRQSVNDQLKTAVNQVNSYSKQIADLNAQIASASAQGQPPNQLLDQRDQVVANLSQLAGISVVHGTEGYSVFLSSGQPLVVSNKSFNLGTKVSNGDPSELDVTYNGMDGTTPATTQYLSSSVLSSGTIGGLLSFRNQTLDPAQAQLGAIATSFAAQVNAQNSLGLDLTGNTGGNLFNVASPTVYSGLANTGTGALTAAFADPTQPTAGDYTLSFDGTNYTLTDNATGTVMGTTTSIPSTGTTLGGLTLSLTGAMNTGDTFTIQPTRGALNSFSLATTSAADIAAASPVLVSTTATNTGSASVTQGSVAAGYSVPASPITVTFSGGNIVFPSSESVSVNGAAATTGTTFPYTSGNSYTLNGITFTVTGTPNNGDTFTVSKNTGTDDGRNALAMSQLVSKQTLGNGTATLTGAYANYVNNIGNAASQLKSTSSTQDALVSQISASQQSVSGVNLDEEASSLIKYQQLYQANSKVIQSAESMFQTLMGIFQ